MEIYNTDNEDVKVHIQKLEDGSYAQKSLIVIKMQGREIAAFEVEAKTKLHIGENTDSTHVEMEITEKK